MFGFKNIFGQGDNSALSEGLKNNPFLVDVRTPEEFAAGSAEGAINIPLNALSKALDRFKNKTNIILFCRSGGRSAQAQAILKEKGIEAINGGGVTDVINAQKNKK